ncbi:hypothetical protein [Dysgonomonas capnocytophagoides]|nr:hypothetical protein [Dysgonomonas capnocytophagoides]
MESLITLTEQECSLIDGGKSVGWYFGYAGGQCAAFAHGFMDVLLQL